MLVAAAEREGKLGALTNFVLNASRRQAASWRKAGAETSVSVNLAPDSLRDPDLPAIVARSLESWAASPGALTLEIVESSMVHNFAEALATIDPSAGARLRTEAEAYRKDLSAAVERTIAISPVVPIRDGTYRSVIPFACYVRGLSTGAWGWLRDGSGGHVGPMYWETVQSGAALYLPFTCFVRSVIVTRASRAVTRARMWMSVTRASGRECGCL